MLVILTFIWCKIWFYQKISTLNSFGQVTFFDKNTQSGREVLLKPF